MKWPWSKSHYAAGAVVIANSDLGAIIAAQCPGATVDDEYARFLLLDYDQARALVARYWDSSYISYGFDAEDFPLCYDFAELCSAKVREAAVRENFKSRPAFGVVRYTRQDRQRHAVCFIVTADRKVHYFEPQFAEVRWSDAPNEMRSIENLDI